MAEEVLKPEDFLLDGHGYLTYVHSCQLPHFPQYSERDNYLPPLEYVAPEIILVLTC